MHVGLTFLHAWPTLCFIFRERHLLYCGFLIASCEDFLYVVHKSIVKQNNRRGHK